MRYRYLSAIPCVLLLIACNSNRQESGEPCEVSASAGAGELVVEDASEQCGVEQSCLSIGQNVEGFVPTAGTCSCRCDGPDDGRPLCHCLEGFFCVQLFHNLSGEGNDPSSYCVADDEYRAN